MRASRPPDDLGPIGKAIVALTRMHTDKIDPIPSAATVITAASAAVGLPLWRIQRIAPFSNGHALLRRKLLETAHVLIKRSIPPIRSSGHYPVVATVAGVAFGVNAIQEKVPEEKGTA